jgi:hypothetical protein
VVLIPFSILVVEKRARRRQRLIVRNNLPSEDTIVNRLEDHSQSRPRLDPHREESVPIDQLASLVQATDPIDVIYHAQSLLQDRSPTKRAVRARLAVSNKDSQ